MNPKPPEFFQGPYLPGQRCIVIIDPSGLRIGRILVIASRRAVLIGAQGITWIGDAGARGQFAQEVENELRPPHPLADATSWWPIRWMVPIDVDPDAELDLEELTRRHTTTTKEPA